MSSPLDVYTNSIDSKFFEKDFSFKCWICTKLVYKLEVDGVLRCSCDKTYADLLKEWPAHKKLLIDAFSKQEADAKKGKLWDESTVRKAIEHEDPHLDPDDFVTIISKFLTKLDAKHHHKFKPKLTKAMKDGNLIAWLNAMDKHIGNAEDYLV